MDREQEKVLKRVGTLLRVASQPWCLRCRGRMKRSGLTSNCLPRWRCTGCGLTMLGSRQIHADVAGKQIRLPRKYEHAERLFREGLSIRDVARIVGINKHTALFYRQCALSGFDTRCGWGQKAGHRGWCAYQYARHPKRQESFKKLLKRQALSKVGVPDCLSISDRPDDGQASLK